MKKLTIIMAALATIVLAACGDKSNEPIMPEQVMNVGDILPIDSGETGWYCDVPAVAQVEANFITALHVGEAKVRNGKHYFRIKVVPRYTFITDPYLAWGGSKAMVKYSVKAQLKKETDTEIYFNALGSENETTYTFDAMGALRKIRIDLSTARVTQDQVKQFLGERYVKKTDGRDGDKDVVTYKSVDSKTNIVFTSYIPSSPLYGKMTIEYTGA